MLILIRGLPGSGKTTLANILVEYYQDKGKDAVAIAADDFMTNEKGDYEFDPKKLKWCHTLCYEDVAHFLKKGYIVIVHNTFSKNWEMTRYFNLAKELKVKAQIIEVKGSFQNIHGVPEEKLKQMENRWEEVIFPAI